MAKKKNTSHSKPTNGHFSPQALFQMKKKETELKLSSYSFCHNPYKALDYTPFIYTEILVALNKQFCKKFKPIKIHETTITESSDYVSTNMCVIFKYMTKI